MNIRRWLILLFFILLTNSVFLNILIPNEKSNNLADISSLEIRAMDFKDIKNLNDKKPEKLAEYIIKNIDGEYGLDKELAKHIDNIMTDIKVFPVAYSEKSDFVEYINSWGYDRTYGGNRVHEGTDIMAKINIRGYYPLVACCDGVIENIGWLELGGYRIGIRSSNGVYAYYAHMYSYEPSLKEGSVVKKGQLLGYMGDSGYSKVEGTVGNFDVHLHFGLYINTEEFGEISINPYYFLKNIENNLIIYDFNLQSK